MVAKTLPRPRKADDFAGLKTDYDRFGYAIADLVYAPDEIDAIEAFFEAYKESPEKVFDGGARFEEIDPKQRQLRAMHPHRYSKQAETWFTRPRLVRILESLLGAAPLGAQTMYYYKPPGACGQGMHQDNFYLLAKPHSCIAAWTAIDPADEENGCLQVAPKSQELDILCPDDPKDEEWREKGRIKLGKLPERVRFEPLALERGQTLFFGGNLIHGSGPNRSATRSRRAWIGHYIDAVSEEVSRFYHPIIGMDGKPVERVGVHSGGGACGDGWEGAVH